MGPATEKSGDLWTRRAAERLRDRGLVSRGANDWRIVDPLLAEWLRRQDPLSPIWLRSTA